MHKIYQYLNPIAHLGETSYSYTFPLIANILLVILSEVYAYGIAKDPMAVGVYIIFVNVAFIIYFAFRDGIRGGLISTILAVLYYFYIIDSRHYKGKELVSGIDTTIVIGIIFLILALIIGWLKQTIDKLIEREADEKKRLETIIEQLPVGVLITDGTGKLIQRNKQVDSILGVKLPIGFVLGQDRLVKEKIDGAAINPSESPLFMALKTGKAVIGKALSFERKDGRMVSLQVSSAPIHNRRRQIIAAASIITDVTKQKDLERQKDDFLSMASHELKTPITSLKMFIDLQHKELETKNPSKAIYYNERIRDQANRLRELTSDLLDVSRIQTGKLRLNKEEFDILQLAKDTVEGLQGTTRQHSLIVKGKGLYLVQGDRYRLYQVLVNLLSNAIKYSPQGEKIIVQVEKSKTKVMVSVQDFGIGINKEQQSKIFDRLYQVTDPEEKTFPGLGLGLYISKEIMDRHNGDIWVESTKRKGSKFYFSLPASRGKDKG